MQFTGGTESEFFTQSDSIQFINLDTKEDFPNWLSIDTLALFLNQIMRPYEDKVDDIIRGIEYALSEEPGFGGFALVASCSGTPIGAIVILRTGMTGYVPENLLLFVGVHPDFRRKGIGAELIGRALSKCEGSVKLHVEPENPAKRLYERVGFTNKYLEMRFHKK